MSAIEVEGLDETQRKISNFIINLPDAAFETMEDAAEEIVDKAKAYAPVKTGYLRDHIDIVERNKSNQFIIIESEAPYSQFLEWATVKMRAQPFMQPAVHEVAQKLAAKMVSKMKEGLNK